MEDDLNNLDDIDLEKEWEDFKEAVGNKHFYVVSCEMDIIKFYEGGGIKIASGLAAVLEEIDLIVGNTDYGYGMRINPKELK